MALALGVHPIGGLTLAGPRAQTFETGPGRNGGEAVHVHPPTGLAGLLDHGAQMRPGLRGPAVGKQRLPPAW
jgi:hypothetical protein